MSTTSWLECEERVTEGTLEQQRLCTHKLRRWGKNLYRGDRRAGGRSGFREKSDKRAGTDTPSGEPCDKQGLPLQLLVERILGLRVCRGPPIGYDSS